VGIAAKIKKLEGPGVDQVSRFKMADEEDAALVRFIRRDAGKSAKANLTQTYVAKIDDDPKVIGYISIMCAEVALAKTYQISDKIGADNYEFQPAVRIARLAIADSHQKNGLGAQLVELAIGITLDAIQPYAGCRFIILDAKRKSIRFYEKLGFRLLETDENKAKPAPLMFIDLQGLT
jgi:predicted N-acetyltransferase YhbS